MRSIDLVKHQSRLLPGLEHALQHLLGEMCQIRKTLKLPALVLVEEPSKTVFELDRFLKSQRKKKERQERREREAADVRGKIAAREGKTAIARPEKTLVKRRRAS